MREMKAKLDEKEWKQKDEQAEELRKREEEEAETFVSKRGRKSKPPEDLQPDEVLERSGGRAAAREVVKQGISILPSRAIT